MAAFQAARDFDRLPRPLAHEHIPNRLTIGFSLLRSGMIDGKCLVEDQWEVVQRFLPPALDDHAKAHGAMRRQRGQITSAQQLLRLLLMHIASGLSLEQTVTRAEARGLAKLNAMALHKRLCSSRRWLEALTSHLLSEIRPLLQRSEGPWATRRRLRILDATTIEEPGATGTSWRLHYSLRLPELCCDFFELTDKHGAESVRRLPVAKDDLVLLDRVYCDRKAIAQVVAAGGQVIVRYNSGAFPLLDAQGQALDLLPRLRELEVGQIGQWPASIATGQPQEKPLAVRVCAVRKSPESALRAARKVGATASRNHTKVRQQTLELTNFLVVVTTLPEAESAVSAVLEFYRARWQVELAFRRLKSLLELGQLPKKKAESSQAWMQGKILTALLIERILCEARFFSPWGYPL